MVLLNGTIGGEPMHALLKHTFLHVQVLVCDGIMPMEVEKDLKPYLKISRKLKPRLYLCVPFVILFNHLLCIDKGKHESFNGLFCHFMQKKTPSKKKQKCM